MADQKADALYDAACAGLHIGAGALQKGHQRRNAVAPEQSTHVGALKAQVQDHVCALRSHCWAAAGQVPDYCCHVTR